MGGGGTAMTSEKINGEQPATIEFGGGQSPRVGALAWLSGDRPAGPPALRGAGIGLASAGFALLLVSEWLPWMSQTSDAVTQDFPTVGGGRVEQGVTQLGTTADILHLG